MHVVCHLPGHHTMLQDAHLQDQSLEHSSYSKKESRIPNYRIKQTNLQGRKEGGKRASKQSRMEGRKGGKREGRKEGRKKDIERCFLARK